MELKNPVKLQDINKEQNFNSVGTLPRDIEYRNSTISANFKGPRPSGFGFSNFQVSDNTRTLMQNSKDVVNPKIDRSNYFSNYVFGRSDDLLFADHYSDTKKNKGNRNYIDLIKTFHEVNPTMIHFFSPKNIDHIHKLIIQMIKHILNVNISEQDEGQIVTIMIYKYKNATYLNPNLKGKELHDQICTLNKDVLDVVVPLVINGIRQYLGYVRDKSGRPETIILPENVNKKGTNLVGGFADHIII